MISRSASTAIGERPALIRNRAKRISDSRPSPVIFGNDSTREEGGLGREIGRRLSIGPSYGRVGALTCEVLVISARVFDAGALTVTLDPSVGRVFRAPSGAATDEVSVAGRGAGELSTGLAWEGCSLAMLSVLEQPATDRRMKGRHVCQIIPFNVSFL